MAVLKRGLSSVQACRMAPVKQGIESGLRKHGCPSSPFAPN